MYNYPRQTNIVDCDCYGEEDDCEYDEVGTHILLPYLWQLWLFLLLLLLNQPMLPREKCSAHGMHTGMHSSLQDPSKPSSFVVANQTFMFANGTVSVSVFLSMDEALVG